MASEHEEYTQISWACSAQSEKLLPKKKKNKKAEIDKIKHRVNKEFESGS